MALRKKMKLPLGSPVYVGDRPASEMSLSIITYDSKSAQMVSLSSIGELEQYMDNTKKSWINISGLKDIDSIKRLGDLFNIHPLTIEDILHTEQQPKIEMFDEYGFLSIKTIKREMNFHDQQKTKKRLFSFFGNKKRGEEITEEFLIDQISIIIMKNVLITFQEIAGASFDVVRKRILENSGDIRETGMEYLTYSLIDAAVDEYFLTLNHLEDDIEDFEDRATKTSDDMFIEEIHDTKRYLLRIKRAILPLAENTAVMSRHGRFFQVDELKPFMQDLNEHLNHALTTVENYREWLSNIMDVNLSVLSHQTNKVMKVLAIISTIFIPLTFIAGIYGMNFEYMPELGQELGYFITLGGMGFIGIMMVIIFKIHHWF
jgi:magnesium transporter